MSDDKEIEGQLWQYSGDPQDYPNGKFQDHLLEQYKLYVEMMDRISQRRAAANTFFLTFNTAIVGGIAVLFNQIPKSAALAFYSAALVFCVVWSLLLRTYRNINIAKFKVISLMEKRLTCSPFGSAEWNALGYGKDLRRYISLSLLETYIPIVFFLIYGALGYLIMA